MPREPRSKRQSHEPEETSIALVKADRVKWESLDLMCLTSINTFAINIHNKLSRFFIPFPLLPCAPNSVAAN